MSAEAAVSERRRSGQDHHDRLKDLLDLSKTSSPPPRRGTHPVRAVDEVPRASPAGSPSSRDLLRPRPGGPHRRRPGRLACFALALVWWVTEPVPTYVTSLRLMVLLVFLDAGPATTSSGSSVSTSSGST